MGLEAAADSISAEVDHGDAERHREKAAQDPDGDQRILNARSGLRDGNDAVHLVVAVPAVDDAVAQLRLREARAVVGAVLSPPARRASLFVAAVGTVSLSVAVTVERYAFARQAGESAGAGGAVRLVRPVPAVVLSVAFPLERNAGIQPGRTGDLVRGARQRQNAGLSVHVKDKADGTGTTRRAVFVAHAKVRTSQVFLQTPASLRSTVISIVHQDEVVQVRQLRLQHLAILTAVFVRARQKFRLPVRPV